MSDTHELPADVMEALIRSEEDDYPRAPWGHTEFGKRLKARDEALLYKYWSENVKGKNG